MEIKRLNSSASELVSRWDSIGTIKRPERNTEMLIQSTESLVVVLYTVNEKVTEERQLGKKTSSKCKKWLRKAAEIQTQVHEIVKSKENCYNSNLLRHSPTYVRTVQSFINKIQSLIEKTPYGSGSVAAYVALGIRKTITSPSLISEAYGKIHGMQQGIFLPTPATPAKVAMTETTEAQTMNAASLNERGSILSGDAYGRINEMQQDICLPTPATPTKVAMTETTEAQTMNAASLNEGGSILSGDAYGRIHEMQQDICPPTPATPSKVAMTETTEAQTMNAASLNERGSILPGDAYGRIHEMQQDICQHTPITPSTDALTDIRHRQSVFAPSQNDGGWKERLLITCVEESREQTINQAEGKIPFRNEGGESQLEADVSRNSELETGNSGCRNEGGCPARHEAGSSAVISSKRILDKILKCMNESTSSSIAIHGTGGIGKTTTLKELVYLVKNMFDVIIWVTVSKDWSTRKIQNDVLIQLGLSLTDSETDSKVAENLFQFLSNRKFLFVMDDVWEQVDLTALGIPNLTPEKVCRIILASRILVVCKEMAGKRVFEMEPLSREEAWALFHEQVGGLVESPGIRLHAENIVRECGGLPLLIIVTGRAMRGVNAVPEWNDALKKLELPRKLGKSVNEAVIQRLKFSFDSLKSSEIKSCFLYCALFTEDHEVEISELVRFLNAEGLISGTSGDKRGHGIVDFLVDASLLQSTKGGLAIRMHDLMRELALSITLSGEEVSYPKVLNSSFPEISLFCRPSEIPNTKKEGPESNALSIPEGCHVLLRAGAGLKEPPPQEKWEHAKVIALMDNQLSRLPQTPSCLSLQKLFLQRNKNLRTIPASFFKCMPALEVLNLSNTRIKFLPQLISNLKGLKILILRNCERLVALPSEVGSLGALEVLDLHGTEVNGLPDEIGALSRLRHLDVSFYGSISPDEYAYLPPDLVSDGIFSKLLSLETLSIQVYPGDQRWTKSVKSIIGDICRLEKLSALSFYFPEVKLLEDFLRNGLTQKNNLLTKFKFVVGYDVMRIVPRVPKYVVGDYEQHYQCLRFVNGEDVGGVVVEVLARTVAFYLDHHLRITSLSEFGVHNISGLKLCIVSECPQIESIVEGKDLNDPTQVLSLEYLSIHYSWNLKCIWKGPIPQTSFSKLRILMVHACPELKYVFTTTMLSCVSNLEELVVEDCSALESIIHEDEITSSESALAPSLRRLTLSTLPKLDNIREGGWPSVEYVNLFNCPNWKTISMNSHVKVSYGED